MKNTPIEVLPNADGTARHFDGTVIRGQSPVTAHEGAPLARGRLISDTADRFGNWRAEIDGCGWTELPAEAFRVIGDAPAVESPDARKARIVAEIPEGGRFVTRDELTAALALTHELIEGATNAANAVLEAVRADGGALASMGGRVAELEARIAALEALPGLMSRDVWDPLTARVATLEAMHAGMAEVIREEAARELAPKG